MTKSEMIGEVNAVVEKIDKHIETSNRPGSWYETLSEDTIDLLEAARDEIKRLQNKVAVKEVLCKEARRVDLPKETLVDLVKCAFEMAEISNGRAAELLGESVQAFRERCWNQSRVDDLTTERDQLKAELEAVREELYRAKWHSSSEILPPSNEEVDIAWNGLELVGHINSFNTWWVNDTPLNDISDKTPAFWRFRSYPGQALAQEGGA